VRTPVDAKGLPRGFSVPFLAFQEELRGRRYSESGQYNLSSALGRFFAYLQGQRIKSLRSVREEDIVSFARQLQKTKTRYGRPFAARSFEMHMGCIRTFFAFLDRRDMILMNPAEHVSFPRVDRLPRTVLSVAEARCLMAEPSEGTDVGLRDRAILEVLYGTAIRHGECLRLDISDADLSRGQLFIRTGKGRKDRAVPIRGRAAVALEKYLRVVRPSLCRDPNEHALFLTAFGRRISKVTSGLMISCHARTAGIEKRVTAHVLRHSCATHLLKGGADVRHIQKILGHSTLKTTMIYTRVDLSDLRRMLDNSHPRGRRRR